MSPAKELVAAVAVFALAIVALALDPIVVIVCTNFLSKAAGFSWYIPVTWMTWLSVYAILGMVRGRFFSNVKED